MTNNEGQTCAGGEIPRRIFVYNGGFAAARLRRILSVAGFEVRLGLPARGDAVAVWGASPTSGRGLAVARRRGVPVVRIEDAFLRSLYPGRTGAPPLGLLIDGTGVHFDASRPSDLETLLATHPLDDTALLDRARAVMARMREAHLSKYSATRTDVAPPAPGYVLVVDQTRGDASVSASGGDRARFLEMLVTAREENPGARILVKTHPETRAGFRDGHFRAEDASGPVEIFDGDLSPWLLLEGAVAVYTLSSQMGLEAIIAGHRPRVFGAPFYAGWGLTEDEATLPRRGRNLTKAQLCAAALILYPAWYDPFHDRLCEVEDVVAALEAQARAWREDRAGWVGTGMRLWKRRTLQSFFGGHKALRFEDDMEKATTLARGEGRGHMVWASRAPSKGDFARLEDGFLRSRGLGAELVPPLSLVLDPDGIYYDPAQPSMLEGLIAGSHRLRHDQLQRTERLIDAVVATNLSKYNLSGDLPPLPEGRRILVPGQVEDDASILAGAGEVRTNTALLARVRAENPDAVILYKPHPDVVAGLRDGAVPDADHWADMVVAEAPAAALLDHVQEVWTMTSLTGFEALLRGCRVTVLGAPFYAGWGLTRDLGPVPERRLSGPRPGLHGLVHATLIAYPRYRDPVTGLPCPVEVIVSRLRDGTLPAPGPGNRVLSKLQGLFASRADLWRR